MSKDLLEPQGAFHDPPTENSKLPGNKNDDPAGMLRRLIAEASMGDVDDGDGATMNMRTGAAPRGANVSQRIPGYEILEELGRGGMGVVYKAWQHSLQRTVALKMIIGGAFAGADDLQRFRAEAMAIARLHHPHLLNIFEIGESDDLPFYAMEYMEGGSLARRLNGRPVDARVAAELVRSLAQAMDYAHKNGIVHRDLKPANILLSGNADSPLENCGAKITDFGIAKHLNQDCSVTRTGDILGTPHYMAPEQALGRSTLIGPAADIYSLGAILYELLTGRAPFQGRSGADVLVLLAKEDPDRPSVWSRNIPPDLETICLKCLEKSPNKRYTSAGALADDLTRYLQSEPIQAKAASLLDRGIKWTRRRPALAAIAVMTACLILLSFGLMAILMQRAVERAQQAGEVARMQDDMLVQSKELLADAFLERGTHLAEKGDVRRGLHWMLRSLELTEEVERKREKQSDLGPIIRMNLASWGECVNSHEVILPHVDWVWDVAFSPNQKFVVTGSKDKKVQVWNAQAAKPVGPALVHPHAVWGVAFHPDGKTLFTICGAYSGAKAGQLRAWSEQPDKPGHFVLRGEPIDVAHGVFRMFVHPQGDRVWISDPQGMPSLFAFDPKAEGNGFTLLKQWSETNLQFVAFSHDGATLATIVGKGSEQPPYFLPSTSLQLWNSRTGDALGEAFEHKGVVRTAFFSKNGKQLVVGSAAHGDPEQIESSMLQVWDIARRQSVATSEAILGRIKASTLSGNGQIFAVSAFEYSRTKENKIAKITDGAIRMWQLSDDGQVEPFGATLRSGHVVWSMAFSPDGRMLLAGCENYAAYLWSVSNSQLLRSPIYHEGNCVKVQFSNDGRTALTASAGGGITVSARLWDVPRFAHLGTPLMHAEPIRSAYWSKDGSHAWIGCARALSRWDHVRGELTEKIAMPELVGHYFPTHDDRAFLAELSEHRFATFDPVSRSFPQVLAKLLPNERGEHLEFNAGGNYFLQTRGKPSGVRMLGIDGKPRMPWKEDTEREMSAFCLSPAGDLLAIAQSIKQQANRVLVLNVPDFKVLHEIPVKHEILSLACSPDGKALALGGRDRQVQRFDLASGEFIGSPLLHEGVVRWMGYLGNDRMLATSSEKGHILLWDAKANKRIGPVFDMRSDINVVVHPKGRYLLTSTPNKMAMTWRVPEPIEGSVEKLRLWVETMTGMEMNAHDNIIPLESDRLLERRQRLSALEAPTAQRER